MHLKLDVLETFFALLILVSGNRSRRLLRLWFAKTPNFVLF